MSKLPSIKDNFADWYQDVVYRSELADQSPTPGCIVIRPYGYALWENIKSVLDKKIKDTGHENAAFPLLIPESFLKKEARHIEGFAPEVAVVTHAGGKKLEKPLVVRPTSETIIHYMFAKWIKSWRDLPIKINQWANIVRWEKRPRAFLRTREFYWQEGHTVHETFEEAQEESLLMLNEYIDFVENYLAIPVVSGPKTESERFAGADQTFTLEALMQDGKALQMCTSHLISQNFAKTFNIIFKNKEDKEMYPYLTSWGATTRLIGAVIMVHGDQQGLIMPPKLAPVQVVIVPIFTNNKEKEEIMNVSLNIKKILEDNSIRVLIDKEEQSRPGAKFYKWELKGVPIRIEIGPKDLINQEVTLVERLYRKKYSIQIGDIKKRAIEELDKLHSNLFNRAKQYLKKHWYKVAKISDFGEKLGKEGGFFQSGWCGSIVCELELKKYNAMTRCLLKEKMFEECFNCSRKSKGDVLIAKSY